MGLREKLFVVDGPRTQIHRSSRTGIFRGERRCSAVLQ
jgi:hypothetical protein